MLFGLCQGATCTPCKRAAVGWFGGAAAGKAYPGQWQLR